MKKPPILASGYPPASADPKSKFAKMSDRKRAAIMANWRLRKLAYHGAHIVGTLMDARLDAQSRAIGHQLKLCAALIKQKHAVDWGSK
jgi:hypothetical protein